MATATRARFARGGPLIAVLLVAAACTPSTSVASGDQRLTVATTGRHVWAVDQAVLAPGFEVGLADDGAVAMVRGEVDVASTTGEQLRVRLDLSRLDGTLRGITSVNRLADGDQLVGFVDTPARPLEPSDGGQVLRLTASTGSIYDWAFVPGTISLELTLSDATTTTTSTSTTTSTTTSTPTTTVPVDPTEVVDVTTSERGRVAVPPASSSSEFGVQLARGGDSSGVWSVVAGALPPGLSLSPDGVISGTPTGPGRLWAAEVAVGAEAAGARASTAVSVGESFDLWGYTTSPQVDPGEPPVITNAPDQPLMMVRAATDPSLTQEERWDDGPQSWWLVQPDGSVSAPEVVEVSVPGAGRVAVPAISGGGAVFQRPPSPPFSIDPYLQESGVPVWWRVAGDFIDLESGLLRQPNGRGDGCTGSDCAPSFGDATDVYDLTQGDLDPLPLLHFYQATPAFTPDNVGYAAMPLRDHMVYVVDEAIDIDGMRDGTNPRVRRTITFVETATGDIARTIVQEDRSPNASFFDRGGIKYTPDRIITFGSESDAGPSGSQKYTVETFGVDPANDTSLTYFTATVDESGVTTTGSLCFNLGDPAFSRANAALMACPIGDLFDPQTLPEEIDLVPGLMNLTTGAVELRADWGTATFDQVFLPGGLPLPWAAADGMTDTNQMVSLRKATLCGGATEGCRPLMATDSAWEYRYAGMLDDD